jgi:hypothetical protein
MDSSKLWRQYNTFRLRKAKQHEPSVYKALQAQLRFFAETRNVDAIPMQPVADMVRKIYLDAGRLWAHQSYLNVLKEAKLKKPLPAQKKMPIGFNEEFINSILSYFRTQLLSEAVIPITETTKDWIRKQLTIGIEQGLGIDAIVAEMLHAPITRVRAELISRTEVMKAANLGEQIGVEKTGLQTQKEWIAIRDDRTRHDHNMVDGNVVDDGEAFTVGIYKMQRPGSDVLTKAGDKVTGSAAAAEVCNCRCCIGRKVLRGKNGLPLRREPALSILR